MTEKEKKIKVEIHYGEEGLVEIYRNDFDGLSEFVKKVLQAVIEVANH